MKYKSDFHQFIHSTLSGASYDALIAAFSSGKRFHHVMANVADASHAELILLSEALNIDTVTLMENYQVGVTTLTPPEKNMHIRLRMLTQKVQDLSGALAV